MEFVLSDFCILELMATKVSVLPTMYYLLCLFLPDFGELTNTTNCIEERIHHTEAALITNFIITKLLFIIIYLMQTMYNTNFFSFFVIFMLSSHKWPTYIVFRFIQALF